MVFIPLCMTWSYYPRLVSLLLRGRLSYIRLELCGALILARLLAPSKNINVLEISIGSIHAWTDSMITIHIQIKVFVGNRYRIGGTICM